MNCIIVDDDDISRNLMKQLASQTEFLNVVALCENGVEASRLLAKEKIDLILLDVEMPEMTGLELLKSLRKKPLVILTTSKKEYAVDAFEYDVVDYLIKPVAYPRFIAAIMKAKEIFDSSRQPGEDSVFIKTNSVLLKINTSEILWIEALGDYAILNTLKKKYTVHCTLKSIESKLSNDKFIRVHRSFIVPIDKINSIDDTVIVINEKLIPIGAIYKENLIKRLNFL